MIKKILPIAVLGIALFILLFLGNRYMIDKNKHVYTGESEHWKAKYTVSFQDKNGEVQVKNVFVVTYKGDLSELSSAKRLIFSYKSSATKGGSTIDFETPPGIKSFGQEIGSTGGRIEKKDEIIYAEINLDGVIETMKLYSN